MMIWHNLAHGYVDVQLGTKLPQPVHSPVCCCQFSGIISSSCDGHDTESLHEST